MGRLIPERTVDSMLAIEVTQMVPQAVVFSPTNTTGAIDHEVILSPHLTLMLECKATERPDKGRWWTSPIDPDQLHRYLNGNLPVLYVLTSRPPALGQPWLRSCECAAGGVCLACWVARSNSWHRRWANLDGALDRVAAERRLQPWFGHWAWVIPARSIKQALRAQHRDASLRTNDADLAGIPGASRLCHLLDDYLSGTGDLDRWALNEDHVQLSARARRVRRSWQRTGPLFLSLPRVTADDATSRPPRDGS